MRPQRHFGPRCAAALLAAAAAACASPPPISHLEDRARLDVPIAICRKALGPGVASDAGAPGADAYWSVVFPSFHGFGTSLSPTDPDCAGEALGAEASAAGEVFAKPISDGDAVLVPGDDGLLAAWLPAFRGRDRTAVGPLALMRLRPSELDVYDLGSYQGSASHSRFALGRLGTSVVVTAFDDRCAEVKVDVECESRIAFYLAAGGQLDRAADTSMTRVRYATLKNVGRVQYRLSTDPPAFDKLTVRIHERLEVRDAGGEDVHKAEGDRIFLLGPDGHLNAQQDSLWSQVPKGT